VGQADFVIDRVYAAVDKLKSLLTAQPARFSAIGREDSDNKLSNVWKTILTSSPRLCSSRSWIYVCIY
jgi:hypothetical protein